MDEQAGHQRFASWITLTDDTPVAVLITDGARQIIARLPEDPLVIHCVKDAPPSITMKWPTQDISVAPDLALHVSALLRDDYGVASARVLVSMAQPTPAGGPGAGAGCTTAGDGCAGLWRVTRGCA